MIFFSFFPIFFWNFFILPFFKNILMMCKTITHRSGFKKNKNKINNTLPCHVSVWSESDRGHECFFGESLFCKVRI